MTMTSEASNSAAAVASGGGEGGVAFEGSPSLSPLLLLGCGLGGGKKNWPALCWSKVQVDRKSSYYLILLFNVVDVTF